MRKYGMDLCRVIACMAVVMSHTLMLFWEFDPSVPLWTLYNLAALIVRCGVPLFFMISGTLLLGREELNIRKHIKRTFHFVILYFVWSAFYVLIDGAFLKVWYNTPNWAEILFASYYHLWYLPALILCYTFIPFLHGMVHKNSIDGRYGVLVFLVLIVPILNLSLIDKKPVWLELLLQHFDLGYLKYLGYILLGWWLSEHPLRGRKLLLIGVAAATAVLIYSSLNLHYSQSIGLPSTLYYDFCSIAMVLLSSFVFCVCLLIEKVPKKIEKLICDLSACTMGIYLVHPALISLLCSFGLDFTQFNTYVFMPLCYVAFFVLPMIISCVFGRIPGFKWLFS